MQDIKILNNLASNSILKPNQVFYVIDPSETVGKELQRTDLDDKTHYLERAIWKVAKPIFFIYYCTADGYFPGLLTFTRQALVFTPLIPDDSQSFTVLYKDIHPEYVYRCPVPTADKELEAKGHIIDYYLQIGLFESGQSREAQFERLQLLQEYREKKLVLLSFHIKLQTHWLSGEALSDQEGEELVTMLEKLVATKAREANGEPLSPESTLNTKLGYFDVAYEEIFPILEEREGSKLEKVDSQLHVLKDIFGFKIKKSVRELKNQSFFALSNTFPELLPQANPEEREGEGYTSYILPTTHHVLSEPSRIIADITAKEIQDHLPGYLKTISWNLTFDRFSDGSSLNNLYRMVKYAQQSIVIILTSEKEVLGGFVDVTITPDFHRFIGTGDCFVFSKLPHQELKVFRSSGLNDNFFYADHEGFYWGSDPGMALSINENLTLGTTQVSRTYDTQPLTPHNPIKILKLEVWSFN